MTPTMMPLTPSTGSFTKHTPALLRKMGRSTLRMLALVACIVGLWPGAWAQTSPTPLRLPSVPWYSAISVPPNIILTLDDSGSMDETIDFNPGTNYRLPLQSDGTPYAMPDVYNAPWDGFINNRQGYNLTKECGWGNNKSPQCTCSKYTSSKDRSNCAIWFSFYRTKMMTTKSSALLALEELDDNYRIAWQAINSCQNFSFATNCKGTLGTLANKRTDLRRWLIALTPDGYTPLRQALINSGEYLKTATPYLTDPTDSKSGMLPCRASYAITMTDGLWNEDDDKLTRSIGNVDNNYFNLPNTNLNFSNPTNFSDNAYSPQAPFKDENFNSLADIAFHYWITDLRPDISNEVAPQINVATKPGDPITHSEFWDPKNDPASWQHMTGFFIGLNLKEQMKNSGLYWDETSKDPTYNGSYPWIKQGFYSWPSVNNQSARVADLWHAAINSRGRLYMADNHSDLVAAFDSIRANIRGRESTITSGASSSLNIQTDSAMFTTTFNSSDWSGKLIKYTTSALASVSKAWDSDSKLTKLVTPRTHFNAVVDCSGSPQSWNKCTSRLFTIMRSTSGAVSTVKIEPDGWPSLKNNLDGDTVADLYKQTEKVFGTSEDPAVNKLLNWLLGDTSEETANGPLRNRNVFLGDIVDSSPVFEAGRDYGYTVTNWVAAVGGSQIDGAVYSRFLKKQASMGKTVYVGANDGMLHAFNADTGALRFSWIPRASLGNIASRAQSSGAHTWYVNGPIVTHHAYDNDKRKWRTVLVASMGAGAKGLFALDVTDPNEPEALWEWVPDSSDPDFNDVGHVLGEPVIAAANNGAQWIVAFGNGYGSNSNRAALFVLDLFTGKRLLKKYAGNATSMSGNANGLSAPALLYLGGRTLSAGYAGDLLGRLWRFDLGVSKVPSPTGSPQSDTNAQLLFEAKTKSGSIQAITAKPRIASDRTLGRFILFGTGRLLLSSDKSSTVAQSVYGIRDQLGTAQRDDLLEQNFSSIVSNTREVSNKPIQSTQSGWVIDLPDLGERVISPVTYIPEASLAVVTSVVPRNTSACEESSLSSWTMTLSPFTGAGVKVMENPSGVHDGLKERGVGAPPVVIRTGGGAMSLMFNKGPKGLAPITLKTSRNPRSSWQQIR